MTANLFELRASDTEAIGTLVDLLAAHCDAHQATQFLTDLARWHRAERRSAPKAHREEARRELEQWQQFLASLSDETA